MIIEQPTWLSDNDAPPEMFLTQFNHAPYPNVNKIYATFMSLYACVKENTSSVMSSWQLCIYICGGSSHSLFFIFKLIPLQNIENIRYQSPCNCGCNNYF